MSEAIKTILIFGGTGFLGKYVVERLARTQMRICIASRHAPYASYLKTAGSPGQIVTIAGDITNQVTLQKLFTSPFYAVINLTGILYEKNTQRFSKIHTEGAINLAKYAALSGSQHFIHISALGIDKAIGSLYAKSKLEAEKEILEKYFPNAVILRPSVVFGEEDKFFNMFASLARFAPFLPLIGGGKTLFQPVYVDDVAKAVMYALEESSLAKGKIFELGGPDIVSFKEILSYILQQTKRERCLLPVPFGLAHIMAMFTEYFPHPPLTRDQVSLLKTDNVVSKEAKSFSTMHITPKSFYSIAPEYLKRYSAI